MQLCIGRKDRKGRDRERQREGKVEGRKRESGRVLGGGAETAMERVTHERRERTDREEEKIIFLQRNFSVLNMYPPPLSSILSLIINLTDYIK